MRSKVPGDIKVPEQTARYLSEGENPRNVEKENPLGYLLKVQYRSNDSTRQKEAQVQPLSSILSGTQKTRRERTKWAGEFVGSGNAFFHPR